MSNLQPDPSQRWNEAEAHAPEATFGIDDSLFLEIFLEEPEDIEVVDDENEPFWDGREDLLD